MLGVGTPASANLCVAAQAVSGMVDGRQHQMWSAGAALGGAFGALWVFIWRHIRTLTPLYMRMMCEHRRRRLDWAATAAAKGASIMVI